MNVIEQDVKEALLAVIDKYLDLPFSEQTQHIFRLVQIVTQFTHFTATDLFDKGIHEIRKQIEILPIAEDN